MEMILRKHLAGRMQLGEMTIHKELAGAKQNQAAFPCQDGQCCMAVLIKGRVAGVEMVSRPAAYRQLHENLLNSYAMDIPHSLFTTFEGTESWLQRYPPMVYG